MNKKLIFSNDVHFFFSQVTEAHANIDVRELQYLNDSLFLYKKKRMHDNYNFLVERLFVLPGSCKKINIHIFGKSNLTRHRK